MTTLTQLPRLLLVFALLAVGLRADEIVENLAAAKAAYEAGNYTEALQALDYAGQLIRQKKADAVIKLLPDAPSGWTADEPESESANAALMGGMVSVKRTYRKGDASAKIEIQSDSPLLQSFAMMFSNPMLLGSSGTKLETIKGQRCAITYRKDDKAGDVKALVDNRYLVTVEGSDLSREDLVTLTGAIRFTELTKLK